MELEALEFDTKGLVAVVAQDAETGEIRMVAYANREAIERTLETDEAYFFSRSRQVLWKKGETSGHTMHVREVWIDCDGDALIYLVDPVGPSCHTGADTCFFRRLSADGTPTEAQGERATATLPRLERVLHARRASTAKASYTKSLLEAGVSKIDRKLREEAQELGEALATESKERVASEAGDLVYHLMVGLVSRDVRLRDLLRVLSARFGLSGHDEKASR